MAGEKAVEMVEKKASEKVDLLADARVALKVDAKVEKWDEISADVTVENLAAALGPLLAVL